MPDADLDASLAERLGGRWAISWQAFAITAPLAIAVLAFAAQASDEIPTWFLIAVMSLLVSASWTYLMHRTLFRDRARQPVSVPLVVVTAVIVGLLYVGTAVTLGLLLDVLEPGGAATQFIPLLIVVVSGGLLLTLVLDSQWRFRVQREQLVQQAVQQQLASVQELDVLREIRASVHGEVGQQLQTSGDALIHRIDELADAGEAEVGALARELREAADHTVRPLSHALEERARRKHRTPGFITALANIVRYQPFRPLAVSVVYLVTATPREVSLYGPMIGFGLLIITVALLFAIMTPLNQAMDRWPRHHTPIYLTGLVLIQAPTVLLSPIQQRVTGEPVTSTALVVTSVLGIFVVVATSSFGSWNRSRREVIADFQREVDADMISTLARGEALAQATMNAALTLHGSVQGQLYACAMVIEDAARKGDLVEVNRALMQARAILEQPMAAEGGSGEPSAGELVTHVTEAWAGLLAVQVEIDDAVADLDGPLARHIAAIVEEGIANAVQHGRATQTSVQITAEDLCFRVTILDNGDGPGGGAPGLGSTILERFGSEWDLEPMGSETRLAVRIPRAELGG